MQLELSEQEAIVLRKKVEELETETRNLESKIKLNGKDSSKGKGSPQYEKLKVKDDTIWVVKF